MASELTPDELRGTCSVDLFQFADNSELDPLDEVIGQERAVQAIDFGLNMKSPGYNIQYLCYRHRGYGQIDHRQGHYRQIRCRASGAR